MMKDDFDLARETALDYCPEAIEVDEVAPSMYLLDAIESDDGKSSVKIMFDESSCTFALVPEYVDVSPTTLKASLIREIEMKASMLFSSCEEITDAASCWAALDSTVSQFARMRIKELGGDVDEVTASLERFFLTHPEC